MRTSVGVEERYESNYLRNPKGDEVEDFVTVIRPGLLIEETWKTLTVTGSYVADIEKVARNSQFDHTAHTLLLDLEATPWAKTGMTITESVSYSPNAFDINNSANTNVLTRYTDAFYNNTYASLSHRFTDSSSAQVAGEYSLQDFSDPSLVDTSSYSGYLLINHSLSPRWLMSTNYAFTRYFFSRGGNETSDVHLASLELTVTFPKDLVIGLSGGVGYTPGVRSTSDIGTDLKWIGGLTVRKDLRRSSFVLEYARGISNAGGITSELSISDTATLVVYTNFTESLSASLTGIYTRQRSAPNVILSTDYYRAVVNGSWRINRRFSMSVAYSHFEQRSSDNSPAQDIAGNTVFVRLSTLIYDNRF